DFTLATGQFTLVIYVVITEELLSDNVFLVEGMKVRPWPDADFRDRPAQLWCIRRGSWNGAGDGRNHNVLRPGIVFSRIGILDPHDVSRTLYQSVLKAPSSTDEGPVTTAGEFNSTQHAVEAFVRTGRRGPESVESLEFLLKIGTKKRVGWEPCCLGRNV